MTPSSRKAQGLFVVFILLFQYSAYCEDTGFYRAIEKRNNIVMKKCCKREADRGYRNCVWPNKLTGIQFVHYTGFCECGNKIEFYVTDNPNFNERK